MEKLIKLLHDGNYSCVVENFDEIYTFSGRGVSDLYDMVKNKPCFLKEAVVADKVVGKAAATLMMLGGVKKVYTDLISLSALTALKDAEITVEYQNIVPYIWNRDKTDLCPLEKMIGCNDKSEEIFSLIEKFIETMKKKQIAETIHI